MKTHLGFGLPEILISLFLSSIIMTALTQFYLNTKHQYMETQKILAKHFDLQWISSLMADSIRRSGFTPCVSVDQLITADRREKPQIISGLKVYNQPNSMIKISRMSEFFSSMVNIVGFNQITVAKGAVLHEKRPLILADCKHAEVHEIQRINKLDFGGYLITLSKPILFSYTETAYVGEWLEEKWFIKTNSRKVNSLYYQLVQTEELTPLVHSLEIIKRTAYQRQLLEVNMGLDENKVHHFTVAVRGA
jgi:hypothetical protein